MRDCSKHLMLCMTSKPANDVVNLAAGKSAALTRLGWLAQQVTPDVEAVEKVLGT
jgi:hypothetical protein